MRTALFVALALVASAGIARAQPVPVLHAEPPTRGPEIPVGVIAGDADATSVVLDAANLAFLPSWNAMAMYSWIDAGALRGPGGGGLYLAAPMPLVERLAIGGAVELLRPGSAFSFGDAAKLSIALGLRLTDSLSLGATYAHAFVGSLGGIDTLDLSAAARLGRWAALSLVVHDLPASQYYGGSLQRVYQPELALRPVGSYRFEIGLSARIGESSRRVDPAVRVQFVPVRGLTVRGAVEYVRDFGDGTVENELRATVGLQLDFTVLGFGAYALFGTRGDGGWGAAGHGAAFTARLSGDRYPAIWRPLRFERIDLAGAATSPRRLPRLLEHLRRLAADERTEGVIVVMGELEGSWATMEELRDAFHLLRAAGKHVVVYGAELPMKAYYAATAAERILLDPAGGVRLLGVQTQAIYVKGTLDKLGARADFVKIAEYKSAPEQLTRAGSTDEARMVRDAILDDLDARVRAAIAADRKLDPSKLAALIDAGPYTAHAAKQAGLVDELRGGEEVETALAATLGGRRVEIVAPDTRREVRRSFRLPALAVIYVDGDIVEGKSRSLPIDLPILGSHVSGHESLLAAINEARADDRVKAIVMRIDSPGGNALASDLIARELLRSRPVKPIICSFGDTAASGGYFIAAGCDVIVAEPSTITGSIGIFAGKIDVSGLAEKLGVTVETGKRGARADLDSWFRPYTDDERAAILERLRYYYERFVATVATGRGLKVEDVEKVARGRVWTGAQAKENKLVDVLGGFLEAQKIAAERGGLGAEEAFDLVALPDEPTTLLGQLAALVGLSARAGLSLSELPEPLRSLGRAVPASLLLGPSLPQARMEFDLAP